MHTPRVTARRAGDDAVRAPQAGGELKPGLGGLNMHTSSTGDRPGPFTVDRGSGLEIEQQAPSRSHASFETHPSGKAGVQLIIP